MKAEDETFVVHGEDEKAKQEVTIFFGDLLTIDDKQQNEQSITSTASWAVNAGYGAQALVVSQALGGMKLG